MNKLLVLAGLATAGALAAVAASRPAHMAASLAGVVAPPGDVDALLQHYDLTPVLRTLPDAPTGYVEPMNGFFGADRYRIEFVMTKVQRDPQQPGRYQVWGKNRFKGRVTPFAGTVLLTQVVPEAKAPERRSDTKVKVYSALGTYELHEAAGGAGAGTFSGKLAVDFAVEPSGEVHTYYSSNDFAKGGKVLYNGTWASTTGEVKPAVWVAEIFSYHGPEVFQNFIVGERSRHFNAKYAKLGWNTYWTNDEWWASEPPTVAKRK